MGNLRDQLKKIKNALGLSGPENKNTALVVDQKKISIKNIQAVNKGAQLKVNRTEPVKLMDQTIEKFNELSTNSNEVKNIVTNIDKKVVPSVLNSSEKNLVQASQLSLPSFTSIARTSEFKIPEAWVAKGAASQIPTKNDVRRSDIFIGLDFGTAFTKAAVQILDNIYPIEWSGVANLKEKYLLPTEFSEMKNKICYLGQHPSLSPEMLHSNLKSSFITHSVTDADLAKAIIFVALVLQYIRAWVYHHQIEKLGAVSIGWYFNIGIPSDTLDKDRHSKNYKMLADTAWTLSLRPQSEITFENAIKALSKPVQHEKDLRDVAVIPELVAQLSGYSKSARRQNGLHVLIDIGGGTVDIVTFNVHQADGDDVFPFFVSIVKPLGSYALLANRLSNSSINPTAIKTEIQNLLTVEAFAKYSSCLASTVKAIDQKFFKFFQKEFESVLGITYSRRYPSSPNWQLGIRTFVSGGGASIPGYIDSINKSKRPANCPLLIMDLPPHPKLANLNENFNNYSRISVACGLAVDAFSLGLIRPASEVEDARPLIVNGGRLRVREMPDRDELYPK